MIMEIMFLKEINENTELDLVEVFMFDDGEVDFFDKKQITIREILDDNKKWEVCGESLCFHLLNDDYTIGQLIWKDGGMVE